MLRMTTTFVSGCKPCVSGQVGGVLRSAESFVGNRLRVALSTVRRVHIDVATARAAEPCLDSTHNVTEEQKPGFLDSQKFSEGESVARWRRFRAKSLKDLSSLMTDSNITKRGFNARFFPLTAASLSRASAFHVLNTFSLAARDGRMSDLSAISRTVKLSFERLFEIAAALRDDIARVRDNVHTQPWDMTYRFSASSAMQSTRRAISTATEMVSIISGIRQRSTPEIWLRGDLYPDYYRYSYHYQTDGWLSSQSAEAYDLLTEVVFSGRQDAMQRVTFHALTPYMRAANAKSQKQDKKSPVVVEVGAGTGRFATFVRDNFRNVELHVSDLSPFYLQNARENMMNWETVMKPDRRITGKTFFVQANAERLPFANAAVDVLYSVYLMHELPPQARRAVVAEAARVLKKGGLFIITDSVQLGDRPWMDKSMGNFSKLNEPWYKSYLMEDFGHFVTADGAFIADRKEICSVTKMLSFIRT